MTRKTEYPVTKPMHNPPHPGNVLKDVVRSLKLTITEAAERLGVDRISLSRVMNGRAGISVEMALRLGKALNTSPDIWLGMQQSHDLWQAKQQMKEELSHIRGFADPTNSSYL